MSILETNIAKILHYIRFFYEKYLDWKRVSRKIRINVLKKDLIRDLVRENKNDIIPVDRLLEETEYEEICDQFYDLTNKLI